jgi:predicted dehydrogenase
LVAASAMLSLFFCDLTLAADKPIRAGIVGCDTSHVGAFTKLINDPQATGSLAEVEVTAAYPGGSDDLPASRDRVKGYTEELRGKGIKIVESLRQLVDACDVIMLESVDGRVHLEQFREIAKGKPVFIDKPAAASLADVTAIFRIADETHTPVYSSSALRFCDAVQELAKDAKVGKVVGCETAGPMSIEEHHPDLFWYGVHGVESLFTIMGTGCESITRIEADDTTLVVGKWKDGRIGSFRGFKNGHGQYSFTLFGEGGVAHRTGFSGYEPSVRVMCDFFLSGKPPVSREETLEIFAFMQAADASKKQDGKRISIADTIEAAQANARAARRLHASGLFLNDPQRGAR